jgi:hypothetical protein
MSSGAAHEDSAISRRRSRRAQRRSSSSFSDRAGTLTATPGQVDALVVGDGAALDDLADDIGVGDLDGDEGDLAVVDEDQVAGAARHRETLVGRPTRCWSPSTSRVVMVKWSPA